MDTTSARFIYPRFFLLLLILGMALQAVAKEGANISIVTTPMQPVKHLAKTINPDVQQKIVITNNKTNDPIKYFGHGQFVGRDGNRIDVTPEKILELQAYYLTKIQVEIKKSRDSILLKTLKQKHSLIYSLVEDRILANALFLDELYANSKSKNASLTAMALSGLRRYYINNFAKLDFTLKEGLFTKGIHPDIAKRLEKEGNITVFLKTNAGGAAYIEECRDAGVPIPPPMYASPWVNRGFFENEFISDPLAPELWFYESRDPEGACLALPRYNGKDGKKAKLLGLICLGKESSNACFWDNPNQVEFDRDVPVSIDQFVGGADLDANNQGTCTACHAGENPFIVHPDKSAFAGLTPSLMANDWYDPLVHPSWPENPGPTTILDSITSESRCDSCHYQGFAGRFPDVSDPAISAYCSAVLETSVFGGIKRTMPQGGGSIWPYFNHIDALLSACYGNVVDTTPIPDDESFISPPIILEPLYACATQVAVAGTLLDANVSLFINGTHIDTKISRSPSHLEFDVPALAVGDVVTAVQEFGGVVSDPSDAATVRDHKVDFPMGLPKPEIDPTLIYECGNTIAVRHVPGAKLTVYVNGTDPRSSNTSTGWTGIYPGKFPFDLGDQFTAEISLCTDNSPLSDIETAVAAPSSVNAPNFDPAQTYVGQELVNIKDILNGAWVEVGESSMGSFGKFSTPVSWHNEYDVASQLGGPLSAGDQLFTQQTLCESGPPREVPTPSECNELPAPKIKIPLEGEDYVVVTEAVPGARIQVYDSSNNELGDGSGNIIALNRALVFNETITVTQSLGECKSRFAYKVKVRRIERGKGRNG